MARAYADAMGGTSYAAGFNGNAAPANTRRYKSSTFNPLYYDPNIRYVVPSNAQSATATNIVNGVRAVPVDGALINGYYHGSGGGWTVDLTRTDRYRPTLTLDIASNYNNTQTYADHAAIDYAGLGVSGGGAATQDAPPYYATFTPSGTCVITNAGHVSNDACYSLVVIKSTVASYSIPPNGTANNGRSDCTTASGVTTCLYAQELQNFANWYSYYRTRHLSMVTATWRVMTDSALSGARVGWQALNSCNSFATGTTCATNTVSSSNNPPNKSNLIDEFNDARRGDLQDWLRAVRPQGSGAPLRSALWRAGQYYSTTASPNDPFLKYPQVAFDSTTNPRLSCRPNFHLMAAGSPWDDANNVSNGNSSNFCGSGACANSGNVDGGSMTWAAQTLYSTGARTVGAGTSPFSDSNANSLSDIAMYYWLTDLRSTLTDNLLPYFGDRTGDGNAQELNWKNDPAVWQHMVNYVVGVGLKNSVNTTALPPVGGWPNPTGVSSANNLYDLWHAAVNSRGGYFGADTPDQLVDAMTNSLSRATPQINGANQNFGASLATNSTRLATDTALYQAQFLIGDWTGRLLRIKVDSSGATQYPVIGDTWEAASKLPANGAGRNIATSTAAIAGGVNFVWGTAVLQPYLGTQAIADYLRGDQAAEIQNGGTFRNRTKILGDLVNSDIVFAGGENFGYQNLSPDNYDASNVYTNSYNLFVAAKQSRMPMIYVGGNDGMLHGFRADSDSNGGGVEKVAYVPRTLLLDPVSNTDSRSALVQMSDPSYIGNHRFYVDGSPWVGDACLKVPASDCTFTNLSTTDWRTVLVGTTGAGGRGVFALDVTDPANFGPSKVLWDLAGQTDNDLGYTIGQPVIGRLNDGNYYAIFGNGYLSTNNCAVLYLVRLADGNVRRISTTEGNLGSGNSTAACATANGLGRPSLFDSDSNRTTEAIYVAGMLGNLWKFDVSDSNPANWRVATGNGTPLFTARNKCGGVQPITGLIEIGAPPEGETGAMIYFGTGRFLSADDRTDTTRQSFYGLLDRNSNSRLNNPGAAAAGDTTCATPPTTDSGSDLSGRTKLQEQTLSAFSNDSYATRTITSSATVNYAATGANAKNLGWYVDLAVSDPVTGGAAGERMVSAPTLLAGRVVFPTLIPSSDVCAGGGTSTLVALHPFNGGKTSKNIFIDAHQVGFDSFKLGVGIVKNLIAIDSGTNVFMFAGGSSGNVQTIKTISQQQTGGSIRGRTAWREVFQ